MEPVDMHSNLILHEQMINGLSKSMARVKKRLHDTELILYLKPPDSEKTEVAVWENKVKTLIESKEQLEFPTLLQIRKDLEAKKDLEMSAIQNFRAQRELLRTPQRHMYQKSLSKMYAARSCKEFGITKNFGDKAIGEDLGVVKNYSGCNTMYATDRNLVRKSAKIHEVSSSLPEWFCPGYYDNVDPFTEATATFQQPFKATTRNMTTAKDLREKRVKELAESRRDMAYVPQPRYAEPLEGTRPDFIARTLSTLNADTFSPYCRASAGSTMLIPSPHSDGVTPQRALLGSKSLGILKSGLTAKDQARASNTQNCRDGCSYTQQDTLAAKFARFESAGGAASHHVQADYAKDALTLQLPQHATTHSNKDHHPATAGAGAGLTEKDLLSLRMGGARTPKSGASSRAGGPSTLTRQMSNVSNFSAFSNLSTKSLIEGAGGGSDSGSVLIDDLVIDTEELPADGPISSSQPFTAPPTAQARNNKKATKIRTLFKETASSKSFRTNAPPEKFLLPKSKTCPMSPALCTLSPSRYFDQEEYLNESTTLHMITASEPPVTSDVTQLLKKWYSTNDIYLPRTPKTSNFLTKHEFVPSVNVAGLLLHETLSQEEVEELRQSLGDIEITQLHNELHDQHTAHKHVHIIKNNIDSHHDTGGEECGYYSLDDDYYDGNDDNEFIHDGHCGLAGHDTAPTTSTTRLSGKFPAKMTAGKRDSKPTSPSLKLKSIPASPKKPVLTDPAS